MHVPFIVCVTGSTLVRPTMPLNPVLILLLCMTDRQNNAQIGIQAAGLKYTALETTVASKACQACAVLFD